MNPGNAFGAPTVNAVTQALDAIISNLNLGLFVYHVEDKSNASSLRLVYANKEASTYTGADMQPLVGMYIHEAFPALAETDIPQIFAEVAARHEPRELGAVEYEDENLARSFYAVKAFPMPGDCVGVVFDNIALRKQVEEKVKHLTDNLKKKNAELEKLAATLSTDLRALVYDLQSRGDALRRRLNDTLPDEDREELEHLVAASHRLTVFVDRLVAPLPSPD